MLCLEKGEVTFPCTGCGACCARVKGESWLSELPIRPDGSCANYDYRTKKCIIYDTRPDICRVTENYDKVEKYCDAAHLEIYGCARERKETCMHEEPGIRLQFETVSTCNAACHFCVYPQVASMRRGQVMDMDLFKRIVDEAIGIRVIKNYSLQGLGEPFLDPHLVERVRYIRERDPHCEIELFTNGVAATPRKLFDLNEAGLDCIVFSLNAVREDQHKSIMGLKDKFDKVCDNIEKAAELDWAVRVHAVMDGENFTRNDAAIFKHRWGDIGNVIHMGNWGADIDAPNRTFKPNETCHRALELIYVMHNGQVTMCCFDPLGEGAIFGDLNTQTLREIYSSEKYVKFREDHFNNEADKYERCAGCTRI